MRAVIQRVTQAHVSVDGVVTGKIGNGVVILFGAEDGDTKDDFDYVLKKCVNLRIFSDESGKMNLALKDIGGEILCISQFTLLGDIKSGNRPGFTRAMEPGAAKDIYDKFCDECEKILGRKTQKGVFGADMKVHILNDGPVTIIVDSRNRI